MEKDNGENDNVVKLRLNRNSHYKSDGGAILTDTLDPVLFATFMEQKKLLEEARIARDSYRTPDGGAILTDKLDPVLFAEYVKLKKWFDESQKLMKQWRLSAYIGCGVVFITALSKIVSEYAKIKGG